MTVLLAVDLGLRTGLAEYDGQGRLLRYSSRHYGTIGLMRRALSSILDSSPEMRWLVLEGGGPIADVWSTQAERRGIGVVPVSADVWRGVLLLTREQRNGKQAKRVADGLARQVIAWSGAKRPTSLRHDAAEAILVGLWGCWSQGLLTELPVFDRRSGL